MSRISWNEYFLGLAVAASKRSTCDRAQVGAVVVRGKRVFGTGYNGAPSQAAECDEAGHLIENGHCIRTIHAEVNAILQAGSSEIDAIYCTHYPCYECAKVIANAKVRTVYFKERYRVNPLTEQLFASLHIPTIQIAEGAE